MREIIFYKKSSGESPVRDFLDKLSGKQAQKVTFVLRIVSEMDIVPRQYFKKMEGTGDLWEVRVQLGSDIFRILGFIDGNALVLTNGFAKKTPKTPAQELASAAQRKREYLERTKKNGKRS